jgi:hypothetical protein
MSQFRVQTIGIPTEMAADSAFLGAYRNIQATPAQVKNFIISNHNLLIPIASGICEKAEDL